MHEWMAEHIAEIRTLSVFGPVILAFAFASRRHFLPRELVANFLSWLWSFISLLLLNVAVNEHAWSFGTDGGSFVGVPIDLVFGWSILWSLIPNIAMPKCPSWILVLILLVLDFLLMPILSPIVLLHDGWLLWDVFALVIAFLPARLLFVFTQKQERLGCRIWLQFVLFSMTFVLMVVVALVSEPYYLLPVRSASMWFIWMQLVFLIAVPALSAVQEFFLRGKGTPFPNDPTKSLVTTGIFAYLRNPMQTTTPLIVVVLSCSFGSLYMSLGFILSLAYAIGFAGWQESNDMHDRFGDEWIRYRDGVKRFVPAFRPWRQSSATLFLDLSGCELCANLGNSIARLHPTKLNIVDASEYPGSYLSRMAYVDHDGFEAHGVLAFARMLEHVNFGFAFFGMMIRLPIVSTCLQVVVDVLAPPRSCPVSRS